MLRSNFDILRAVKSQQEGRKLTLRVMSDETGLSKDTLSRLSRGDLDKMYMGTIAAVCDYFGLESVSELVEYSPDGTRHKETHHAKATTKTQAKSKKAAAQ